MVWLLLGLTSTANAAGYYFPDSGVVALGRGGAFTAGAEGQFAQYYNPAGLVRTTEPTVSLGAGNVAQDVTFTRQNEDGTFADPVHNSGGWFTIPEGGFVMPLPDYFVAAIGFTSPYSAAFAFPADGAQRYSIENTQIYNFWIPVSLAWRPIKQLAIGASFEWAVMTVGENFKVTTSGKDDPSGDVNVDANVVDAFTPTFNVGVLVDPVPAVSIGASYQPPVNYYANGKGVLDFTNGLQSSLDKPVWTDDSINLGVNMPACFRAGVLVRPAKGLEIEGDFVYEGWHRLQTITVSNIDITVTGTILGSPQSFPVAPSIDLPAGFNDAESFRLGGSYKVSSALDVRAGGAYETPSMKESSVSAALLDTKKVQGSAGVSVHIPKTGLSIDGSGSLLAFQDLTIRDSTVSQINVFHPGEGIVVGNGDFKSLGYSFGFTVRYAFKRPKFAGPVDPE